MYLSGAVPRSLVERPRPDIGLMLGPGQGNRAPLSVMAWAADNGCFSAGDRFDGAAWLRWLASLLPWRDRCLFAVAPDIVGDAVGTLVRAEPYLPQIRALGYRAAFVTQDGCRSDLVPWDACDVLFVGGSTAWKLSEASYALCDEARRRRKRTHMGRVNSLQRLRACAASGIDSADGTFVAFGPRRRLPELMRWMDAVNGQGTLMAQEAIG